MDICVLGNGVIGTLYGSVFKNAGHTVKHLIREEKKETINKDLTVQLLDGRTYSSGKECSFEYHFELVEENKHFDFILLSVGVGNIASAVETIKCNEITGTIILFCNFWEDREYIDNIMGTYNYIICFPVAGGSIQRNRLNGVLFDHIMAEKKELAAISNYDDLMTLLTSCSLKAETPFDMVQWIWIHMAINAGVTSVAIREGDLSNPQSLALELMENASKLSLVVKTIRETTKVVASRGVNLKNFRNEVLPYKFPASLSGIMMKRMFKKNKLARKIMTLHNDKRDILYVISCVNNTAKENHVVTPIFSRNIEKVLDELS